MTFDAVKFGEADEVYQQLVVDVSTRCGAAAAQRGVARFIELSTAQVYEPNEKGSAETGAKLKPWTKQATYKLRAEAILRDVPGLNLVVLRAATIYGPGDVYGLSPRVICADVEFHNSPLRDSSAGVSSIEKPRRSAPRAALTGPAGNSNRSPAMLAVTTVCS